MLLLRRALLPERRMRDIARRVLLLGRRGVPAVGVRPQVGVVAGRGARARVRDRERGLGVLRVRHRVVLRRAVGRVRGVLLSCMLCARI